MREWGTRFIGLLRFNLPNSLCPRRHCSTKRDYLQRHFGTTQDFNQISDTNLFFINWPIPRDENISINRNCLSTIYTNQCHFYYGLIDLSNRLRPPPSTTVPPGIIVYFVGEVVLLESSCSAALLTYRCSIVLQSEELRLCVGWFVGGPDPSESNG